MALKVCEIDAACSGNWNTYVHKCPDASHYHQYEWREFFSGFYRKQTFYFLASENKKVVGLLPLVRQKSLFFGDYLVSLPFVNYGGILADSDEVVRALINKASNFAESLGVSHVELREYEQRPDFPCRTDKVSMRLTLPASAEEFGKTLGAKTRSQIKRPIREDPEVSIGGIEIVDRFYVVFSRNMRDLGTPVYAKAMFDDILRRFPEESSIVLIEIQGRPAAAAFLLHFRDTTEVTWASADRQFNKISINMFMYWEILKFSIERGSTIFDFGRSTVESGSYRFKKQWGAKPVQLYWNYWLKEGHTLPKMNPDNPKYALAISAWKKLPLRISNLLGPLIVRHLP